MMFSLIIPAYNEEKYIGSCLRSVFSLEARNSLKEVIVVNNASTDRTAEVVRADYPQAKLVNEARKGLTIAYNRGAAEATGDVLIFVDADMVLPHDHLRKLATEFEKEPELVALSGPYVYKDNGRFTEFAVRFTYLILAMPAEFILNRLLNLGASIASGNSAFRREAFHAAGGFNEGLFYGLETELALRMRKVGKVRFKHHLCVRSSARRLKNEGTCRLILRHMLNTLWPAVCGKPFTRNHRDIR